jgi:hypothetical protein
MSPLASTTPCFASSAIGGARRILMPPSRGDLHGQRREPGALGRPFGGVEPERGVQTGGPQLDHVPAELLDLLQRHVHVGAGADHGVVGVGAGQVEA